MEKRLLIAVLLMSATVILTNLLFPPPEQEGGGDDTVEVVDSVLPEASPTPVPSLVAAGQDREAATATTPIDTISVRSPIAQFGISTAGGLLVGAELLEYPSYTTAGAVQLVPPGEQMLRHRVVIGADTIDLAQLPFSASTGDLNLANDDSASVELRYTHPEGFGVSLVYTFHGDRYLIGLAGQIHGAPGAKLLTDIGPGLALHEAEDHHSERQLEFVVRGGDGVNRIRLAKVGAPQSAGRSLTWAGLKDKYFLAAIIGGDERPLVNATLTDRADTVITFEGGRDPVQMPRANMTVEALVDGEGAFGYAVFLGPQQFDLLAAVGYDLENVTQYAYRWLEPVIRPVAAAILWVLNILHDALGLAYGWVLVLFGVIMRVVLWPLNAKAMRAQMKNMAVQPLMQEIREKYAKDPQRQQAEMMKLIKEHGFNPMAGCLPLLVPFPILITLFFVFQNTIAFRGADFLWLPDLSLRDPIYILPLFLMVSMFALQLISAKASGMENNPQMKMMMYFMPIMMGVIFFNLPAGLNLYYATTNIASIPQQLLIARERRRAREAMDTEQVVGRGRPKGGRRRGTSKR